MKFPSNHYGFDTLNLSLSIDPFNHIIYRLLIYKCSYFTSFEPSKYDILDLDLCIFLINLVKNIVKIYILLSYHHVYLIAQYSITLYLSFLLYIDFFTFKEIRYYL